jgi:hypothetical protein
MKLGLRRRAGGEGLLVTAPSPIPGPLAQASVEAPCFRASRRDLLELDKRTYNLSLVPFCLN